MKKWLKRIRGALGLGLTWAAAWFGGGAIFGVITGVFTGSLVGSVVAFGGIFAALGFGGGTVFSIVLGIVEGRRRFDEMSLLRFAAGEVYGFEVVDSIVAEGWSYWYAIHNHTVQKNGDLLALGVPAPSTSDVGLYRSLAEEMGLESLRVTNGFYTFSASTDELGAFRAR